MHDGADGTSLLAFDRAGSWRRNRPRCRRLRPRGGGRGGTGLRAGSCGSRRLEALGLAFDRSLAPDARPHQQNQLRRPRRPRRHPRSSSTPGPAGDPRAPRRRGQPGALRRSHPRGRGAPRPRSLDRDGAATDAARPAPRTSRRPSSRSSAPLLRRRRTATDRRGRAVLQRPGRQGERTTRRTRGRIRREDRRRARRRVDLSGFADSSLQFEAEVHLDVARRGPMDFDHRGFRATSPSPFTFARPRMRRRLADGLDVEIRRTHAPVQIASSISQGSTRTSRSARTGCTSRDSGSLLARCGGTAEESWTSPCPRRRLASTVPRAGHRRGRLDRLSLSGVDFVLEDHTADPPLLLPITDAQLEVQRFSTRTFTEPGPSPSWSWTRARSRSRSARAGTPDRSPRIGGQDGRRARDSFEQAPARLGSHGSRRAVLGRSPRARRGAPPGPGLPAFRGPASAARVEIGDGLLDTSLKLRFRDDGGLNINQRTTASYLSLSSRRTAPSRPT